MREGLLQQTLALVASYGYLFLFVASLAENIFLVGFVIPGDLVVVLGGGLAQRAGLSPVTASLAVVAGVLLGSNLSFWIGRRGGTALIERWGERFGVGEKRVRLAEVYFAQHGAKTVFVGSFISGLKNLVPAVAGASRMGFVRFAAYSAIGSTCRAVALVAIGYLFGANLERAIHVAGSINGWVLALVAAALVWAATHHYVKKRRRLARESGTKPEDRVDGEAAP
ncbi:MAG TPA: DedA family protein [Polyangiaceae bacterium]|nr:DedA family protein [Polyangiaceae bacterium]